MKHIKALFTLAFLLGFGMFASMAQQGVVASGGEATGSVGTMSFATGQTDFGFFSSEAGSMQFGLQHAFVLEDDEEDEIPLIRELTTKDLFSDEDQCFDAHETIILAGGGDTFIVDANTGVELIAGNNIRMLPGTVVEYGGYMHARISKEGLFCDVEKTMVASIEVDKPDNTTQQEPLSTKEIEPADTPFFRVYPNPSEGDFTVELTDGMGDTFMTIEVYGMRGELIKRHDRLPGWQHHLSLQGHQPGLYMIRVQRGDELGVDRIIKR